MKHPTWDDIRRFCEIDGWEPTHAARGRKRRDHDRFTKVLADGSVLRTRASHSRDEIGDPRLVRHILSDQLKVSEYQFWDAVDNGRAPQRNEAVPAAPESVTSSIPGWLAVSLSTIVGLSDDEILSMDEHAAMQAWLAWCQRPSRD
ncbi:MAG: hypothetical protein WD576_01770 [Nitriliruptoraceae bacterium]